MQLIAQFLPSFLLIFCRITAFFAAAPIYSFRSLPNSFKVGLAVFISLLVTSAMGAQESIILDGQYILLIVREILIGLLLGFTAYLLFTVVQVAGSFIDIQMGFGIVNVIDPMTGAQSPIMGNFKFFVAILLFLSVNGHHYLLMSIMRSYDWVPMNNQLFSKIADGSISTFLVDSFVQMFYLAFQMAAPMVAALFLVDVALGVLARTVPQFNVFVVGLPIKIAVGFILLVLLIPSLLFLFTELFTTMLDALQRLLNIIAAD
jgi:flagellar biosynthetic protein FliR